MPADRQPLLIDRLREAGLLEPATLDELATLREAADPDPRALGKVLFARKLLTRFQVNQLAQGRGEELQVGPYLLLDRLGEGAMGQVFKARHRHMSRTVALKVIRRERLANPNSVKRFYQEVQAASQLQHPNIVLAYDAGQAGATHYFAMEYVEGDDLARQVKDGGPLPVALACEYARQAALGLQHAHEKGLVHRDVKPHNLLVAASDGGPVVKLLDMGLARPAGQGETSLTQSGQVLGTPDYLAPEQAFDARKADARSDVYSLGCTLYFLLTGSPPFTGDSLAQVLLKHQMEHAPPLGSRRPDAPPALSAVVARMMAKSPRDRYQSAAEVAAALEPLSRGGAGIPPLPKRARTEEPSETLDAPEPVRRPSRSDTRAGTADAPAGRGLTAAAVLVPLAGLLSVGLLFALWPKEKPARQSKDKVTVVEEVEPEKPKAVAVEGPKAPPAPLAKPHAAYPVEAGLAVAASPDGGWAVIPTGGGGLRRIDARTGKADPAVAGWLRAGHLHSLPDGKHVLAAGPDPMNKPTVAVLDAATGAAHRFDPVPNSIWAVHVSPDGRVAAVATGRYDPGRRAWVENVIHLFDVTTGKVLRTIEKHEDLTAGLRFTPDGERLVATDQKGDIRVWRVADGTEVARHRLPSASNRPPAISADGRRAAFACGPGLLWLDLESGKVIREAAMSRFGAFSHVAAAAGGRHVLAASYVHKNDGAKVIATGQGTLTEVETKVQLFDGDTGAVVREFPHDHQIYALSVSADGKRLFTNDKSGALHVWDLEAPVPRAEPPAPKKEPPPAPKAEPSAPKAVPLASYPLGVTRSPAPTPDGRWLLIPGGAGGVQRVDARTGKAEAAVAKGVSVRHLEFLPDGKRALVSGSRVEGAVVLLDAMTGKTLHAFEPTPNILLSMSVSPNGRVAAVASFRFETESGRMPRSVENVIRLYDIDTGKVVRSLEGHEGQIGGMRFTADGKALVSHDEDGNVSVWRVSDGVKVASHALNLKMQATPPALSADGRRATFCAGRRLVWLDIGRKRVVREADAGPFGKFTAVAEAGDGGHVVAASYVLENDGTKTVVSGQGNLTMTEKKVRLYHDGTAAAVREFPHEGEVRSLVVAPVGRRLFTVDGKGVLHVWSLEPPAKP